MIIESTVPTLPKLSADDAIVSGPVADRREGNSKRGVIMEGEGLCTLHLENLFVARQKEYLSLWITRHLQWSYSDVKKMLPIMLASRHIPFDSSQSWLHP